MIFGQLTNRDSLRDLIFAINAHNTKSYHLGLGKNETLSNLSKANQNRSSKIFEEFAYHLIANARKARSNDDFEIEGQVYAFDSSTIDFCLSVFWWAKFRKNKGGIKLNTLFDINTQIPAFIHITPASNHDVNAMDYLIYEIGAYYIFDRGYIDYTRLYKINQFAAYFVVRAKSNLKFNRMYSRKYDKTSGVKSDQIGKHLLFILLSFIMVYVNAQTTETYNIDWSFGSNPSASGDANSDRTIEVGDTVIWTWYLTGNHNVVSNVDATESFASELLGPSSNFSHTFTQVGTNGYVCTPHSGNMFGTITVVPEGTLNTEDFTTFEDIKLYPNPAKNQLNITFGNIVESHVEVEIFNALGQLIKTFEGEAELNMSFDISELNSGLYLVKISQNSSSVTKRLVI